MKITILKNKLFILLFLLLQSGMLFAKGIEYSIDSFARSSSPALAVVPSLWYRFLPWGQDGDPLRGFVRPILSSTLSPGMASGRLGLDVYPVSFIGLSAGRSWIRRFSDFPGLDCDEATCIGDLAATDLSSTSLFKFSNIFGMLKYSRHFYDRVTGEPEGLIDPVTATILSANREVVSSLNIVVGYSLTTEWSTGVMGQYIDLRENSGTQNTQYIFLRRKKEEFTYLVGGGRFDSELRKNSPSFIFSLNWAP